MLVKQMLPRARERLAVIETEAPVREATYLMSKPHTDLVVVCSHGDMVGVVTKTDIVRQISRCTGLGCTTRVESVMLRQRRARGAIRFGWFTAPTIACPPS
jgi:CBS domain-containing protein